MVRFENVGIRYGRGPDVLAGISFHLPEGSFRFLIGPSGAGKSSLLRLLLLADRPSQGAITMFGDNVLQISRRRRAEVRRQIGAVFQDDGFVDHVSVRENAALPLRVAGAAAHDIDEAVNDMLEWMGLGHRVDALPPALSSGEAQRLAVARAVICRPRLLLVDEPTASMDASNAQRVLNLLEGLNGIGTAVVVATHDEALADHHAHPRLNLEGGQLVSSMRRGRG